MADKYGIYCPNCEHKDVPEDEMPCAGDGFPPFWPHGYPNCFKAGKGVTIDIAGRLSTPESREEQFIEELTEAVASDEVMEEMDRIVAEEEELGDELDEEELAALEGDTDVVDDIVDELTVVGEEAPGDEDEELYGEETEEEDKEPPLAAIADVDAKGLYYCTECGHNHKYGSKLGKEHLEHAGDPPQD